MSVLVRHVADVNPPTSEFDRLGPNEPVTFMPLETVWADSKIDTSRSRTKAEVATGYTRFRDGDIIVPKVTPTFQAGRSALVNGLRGGVGVGSTELHVLRPKPNVDPRFLRYVMLSSPFLTEGVTAFQGVAGLQRVPDEFVRNFSVAQIALAEQRRIADFLDAETSRIDELRNARARFQSAMTERFKAEVSTLTGRSTAWSDSGYVLPLRRAVARVKTGGTPSSGGKDYFRESDGVPWYAPASFGSGPLLGAPAKHLSPTAISDGVVPKFNPNSVLIVGIGATAGKVAHLDKPASGNQQITAVEPNDQVHSKFLSWQLWSAREELLELAPFTTMPIINNDFLRSFPVYVPARSEQQALVARIEKSWAWISATGSAIARQLDLLAERRQALITAAVTGQLDVTTARSGVRV